MNGLPYYKAFPRDFFDGTIGFSFELKGAYRLVLDMIYMQGGSLPDDAKYISGLMGCSVRAWNGYREKLIAAGKIQAENGIISNFRADKELESLRSLQDKQRQNARQPRKNNNLAKAMAKPKGSHTESDTDIRDISSNEDIPISPLCDVSEAVAEYNAVASRAGWPQVQKMTDTRRRAARSRLGEVGGMAGWRTVLEKAEASDFLSGRSGRWSGFGFDWLISPRNFVKIMEGNYDNRRGAPSPQDSTLRAIANAAGAF